MRAAAVVPVDRSVRSRPSRPGSGRARRVLFALAAAFACVSAATAEDATPPANPNEPPKPPAKPPEPVTPPIVPRKVKPPSYVGIRWEREFDAGMRRSVVEGRPVYLCVNALVDEGERGNLQLWSTLYPSKEMGDATHEWVCFVANGNSHGTATVDGEEVCERYSAGTCDAHKAALDFMMKRYSADGASMTSPGHAVVDPDGTTVYHGDFMQSALTAAQLDEYLIKLSPRVALRRVWSVREARTDALQKEKDVQKLAALAKEWIATKDPWAPAGVFVVADQELDASRKKPLLAALEDAGPAAVPLLFDVLDAASTEPDGDLPALEEWLEIARRTDTPLFAWAAARAIVLGKGGGPSDASVTVAKWLVFSIGEAPPAKDPGTVTSPEQDTIGAAFIEALMLRPAVFVALAREKEVTVEAMPPQMIEGFEKAANRRGWPRARMDRAFARVGKRMPPAFDTIEKASRDERRRAWMDATPDEVKAAKAKALAALKDPVEEVRVAAAVGLRRAGDPAGASILLEALGDPVEGPEVHEALVVLAGKDHGEAPDGWTDFVRAGGGK